MPDEKAQDATRSDNSSAEDSLFGEMAADEEPAAVAEKEDFEAEMAPDDQRPGDGGEPDSHEDAARDGEGSGNAGDKSAPADELKVVVSMKGDRATIGVQQPASDPHIESFNTNAQFELGKEVVAVIERAKARWEDAPKNPAYVRPAPPAKRRNQRGRQQGETQEASVVEETAQPQPEAPRLF